MSNSRNSWNEDNSKLVAELDKYKKSLTKSIKLQAELEKRLKIETSNQSVERKNHTEEKNNLLKHIEQLTVRNNQLAFNNDQLTAYGEQLERNLINANEQIKNLAYALEQSQAALSSTSSALENKSSSSETENKATPAVTEPASAVVVVTKTTELATAAPATAPVEVSSYTSMFSPWRLFGSNKPEATPTATPENPAHVSLADLTKASVEQALAESNTTPTMHR